MVTYTNLMESLLTRWLTNLSSCNISFNSTIWLHIQISWIHCSPEWWTHLLIVLQASKLSYGYIYKSNGFISDKNKPRYISLNSSFTILIRNESVRFVYVTQYGNIEAWITTTDVFTISVSNESKKFEYVTIW